MIVDTINGHLNLNLKWSTPHSQWLKKVPQVQCRDYFMALKRLVIFCQLWKYPNTAKHCGESLTTESLFSKEGPAKVCYAVAAWCCSVKVRDLINIGCCASEDCHCHYLVLSLQQQIIIYKDELSWQQGNARNKWGLFHPNKVKLDLKMKQLTNFVQLNTANTGHSRGQDTTTTCLADRRKPIEICCLAKRLKMQILGKLIPLTASNFR